MELRWKMPKVLNEFVQTIKGKEYAGISDETVLSLLSPLLEQDKKARDRIEGAKEYHSVEKTLRPTLKKVREKLHHLYASYHTRETKKIFSLLDELKKELKKKPLEETKESHKQLLAAHRSTKERVPLLDTFYEEIFSYTGVPKHIVDIACGLNPLTAPWIGKTTIEGFELSELECEVINQYGIITRQNISAQRVDLLIHLPKLKAEQLFAFKFFELIPTKRVEEILIKADVDFIIASFPTKTIKNEQMAKTTRAWFHLLLRRIQYPYKVIQFSNEIVYIIKKNARASWKKETL